MLSANEGDARDWPGIFSNGEELRRARAVADLTLFPDAADNARLGGLNVYPYLHGLSDGLERSLCPRPPDRRPQSYRGRSRRPR